MSQSATQQQYGTTCQPGTLAASNPECALPSTGLDVGMLVFVAFVLVVLGLLLRSLRW